MPLRSGGLGDERLLLGEGAIGRPKSCNEGLLLERFMMPPPLAWEGDVDEKFDELLELDLGLSVFIAS